MLSSFIIPIIALLATQGAAIPAPAPNPQGLDFDLIAALPPPPTPTIAVGVAAQSVKVNVASMIKSVAQAVSTDPIAAKKKRQVDAATCSGGTPQPTGSAPTSTPDTPDAFASNPYYSQQATSAGTPRGYTLTFSDLNAAESTYYYLGFQNIATYNPGTCAAACNGMATCSSFNIYFERDPTVDPGSGTRCDNPPSTTNIKCSFWAGPMTASQATNTGQTRDQFVVLIAGSNGYESTGTPFISGFAGTNLGQATINAPLDCNGNNPYIGSRVFNSGPYDPSLCAAACEATTSSSDQVCRFFTTYELLENGQALGQYCALYTESYDASYATNVGQYDQQGNHYTLDMSYSYSLDSDPMFASACVPGETVW